MVGLRLILSVLFSTSAHGDFDPEWMRSEVKSHQLGLQKFQKDCKIERGLVSATESYLTCESVQGEVFEGHIIVLTADRENTFVDGQDSKIVEDEHQNQVQLHYLNKESVVMNMNYGHDEPFWLDRIYNRGNPEKKVSDHFSIPFYLFHGGPVFTCIVLGVEDDDLSQRKVARALLCGIEGK